MKTILCTIALLFSFAICSAQDYFAIVKKNDAVTYNYPKDTDFTLIDAKGNEQKIRKGDAITVTGEYKLKADVFWKDAPDIIDSDGGTLEIFVLKNSRDTFYNTGSNVFTEEYKHNDKLKKPQLERKVITISEKNNENFNSRFVFTNGMFFSYTDGIVRAYQNGTSLPIFGKYVIKGETETLKISYNPKNGKMWYVFEKTSNE